MPAHVTAFAPGRVNLIGEHTDYNEGLALPFAIAAGVTVKARALPSARIEAVALDLAERDGFDLDRIAPAQGWRAFVRGAVAELRASGLGVTGAELEITGDVPRGAGLASSAALSVAVTLALLGVSAEALPERNALARICSRVETEWVGAQTGLLDQLASLHGGAVLIDFRTLTVEPVALRLDGVRLVVLDSGQRRELGAVNGYNDRRAECRRACELLGVGSLRDVVSGDRLPAPLGARVHHVISENERVRAAVDALSRGDAPELGRLLDASHASLRDDFAVSTAAVEAAVKRLHAAGALGARVIGGGFGGHVLGLMPAGSPLPPGAVEVRPGPGARMARR